MSRTVYLVDGFNLYHSLIDVGKNRGVSAKWLDIWSLCACYLPVVGRISGAPATLERVYYFSAVPRHRDADTMLRHEIYMRCLRATGIRINLARFKRKDIFCKNCHTYFTGYEEKETDVAMAAKLFEVCHAKEADAIVLVTGDTDLAPAVTTCRRLFPQLLILFAFPYMRVNAELKSLAPQSFKIKWQTYLKHQLPDPFELRGGARIQKPETW